MGLPKTIVVSIQKAYSGQRSFLDSHIYAGFPEQFTKLIIIIAAKTDQPFYLGVHQHLGTQYAGGMGGIDSAPLKADTMETSLYDYILLGMNAPADFVSCPRRYIQLIPETTKLKAVFSARGSAVVASSQYMFIPCGYRTDVMPAAG